MLSDDAKAKINAILVDELGADEAELLPEANLFNDLGADSLDLQAIGFDLEEVFELEREIEPDQIETVGQIYSLVERALG